MGDITKKLEVLLLTTYTINTCKWWKRKVLLIRILAIGGDRGLSIPQNRLKILLSHERALKRDREGNFSSSLRWELGATAIPLLRQSCVQPCQPS